MNKIGTSADIDARRRMDAVEGMGGMHNP